MAKFKKYSMKFMCIVSVFFTFMTALFYPIESFKADVTTLVTYQSFGNVQYVFDGPTCVLGSGTPYEVSGYSVEKSVSLPVLSKSCFYFIRLDLTPGSLSNVISYSSDTASNNAHNYLLSKSSISVEPYFSYGGNKYYFNYDSDTGYWYYRGFIQGADAFKISLGVDFNVFIPDYADMTYRSTFYPSYSTYLTGQIIEYSGEDATTLENVVIVDKVNTSNSLLQDIINKLDELFSLQGDETLEDVPTDDMTDLGTKEDDLLGSTTPDDAANSIDVTIDADSSAVIWDIINDFVTSNDVVFGGFISLLSLGVIALILNR